MFRRNLTHRGLSVALALLCGLSIACRGETLKKFLMRNQVPPGSFTQTELMQAVQGTAKSDDRQVVLIYRNLEENFFIGLPHLLRYDRSLNTVSHGIIALQKDDICSGSPGEVHLIDGFTLISIDISPSAECLLVMGTDLKLKNILYGFDPVVVIPGSVVIQEDMIHFAPAHPGRLQLADLVNGTTAELYPPKDDALRQRLIAVHAAHMPPNAVCAQLNDPCDPVIFDEDVRSLTSDGKGRFAFIASQSASHAPAPEAVPVTVAAQTVLYVYSRTDRGWRYCEEELAESQSNAVGNALRSDFDAVASRCNPLIRVIPDVSTAAYNPFSR